MSTVKTTLDWPYKPSDFFEAPVHWSDPKYELDLQDSAARAILTVPQDPVPDALLKEIEDKIATALSARMVLTHQDFKLEGVRIRQDRPDGSASTSVTIQGVALIVKAGSVDIIQTDATGCIVKDTRAERIASHQAFIALIANVANTKPLLKQLMESYRAAVSDPKDELVHLYEIREALGRHYGSERKALTQLGISKSKWTRLGILSNVEPVRQSRHRGKHSASLRPATPEEMNEAREIARELIELFAKTCHP